MSNIGTAAGRFIHTNFLARQHIRSTTASARKISLWIVCMGLLLMLCFFMFLWVRLYILEIGYQISSAHAVHEQMLQENRQLKIERASLRDPSRIEEIAKKDLGMVIPDNNQMVVLQW